MIDFLNNNAGVIAAIQTVITFALSVLAIAVAIIIARIPYKKKLTINCHLARDEKGEHYIDLCIYNAGNVPLYLENIYFEKISKKKNIRYSFLGTDGIWNRYDEGDSFLTPKMMYQYKFDEFPCEEGDEDKYDLMITVATEEKRFEKRMGWVHG